MSTQPTTGTIMERLKAETQPMHDSAEGKALQKALLSGRVSREAYAAWLGQMLVVHRAVERPLRDLRSRDARVARVVRDEQFQEQYLTDDLAALGAKAAPPTPGVAAFVEEIARSAAEAPIAVLGMHYVLEGSNNGNRFIAMAVRKGLGLAPGRGDRYLDPYGERQRPLWQQFKDDMNACEFTPTEQERMIAGARAMFAGIARLSDDLAPMVSAPA